jgi:2-polyprenyl-3-methyl-5-hydroxy-6-metoxy-1,4-benzoquinol methylase
MASFFNEAYKGTPLWDIGRPQEEFVRIARKGEIMGKVLDIGCGTGENAIFFAGLGHEVWGLDGATLAIETARKKALERSVQVNFIVGNALHLEKLEQRFDTITDCGLFHTFSDERRVLFAKTLKATLKESGTYFMLCFSDKEPAGWGGPRRVSKDEIMETFGAGWRVNYVREARFSTTFDDKGAYAWLSSISSV